MRKATLLVIAAVLSLGLTLSAQDSPYQMGDVFVSIGNGQVDEFTPAGVLVQNLNDGTGSGYTTGSAFDSKGNFYVTNFSLGTISEFNGTGGLVNGNFVTGQVTNESISMPNGLFPMTVGDADLHDGSGNGIINQYNANGVLLNSYHVQAENRGTDWVDVQPNGKTIYYTSEGSSILSYTIGSGQNAPFATGLPGAAAYALRTVLVGAFAGDVLVADSSSALLVGPGGAIVKTYNLPGNLGADFALNLDPSGKNFWTADLASGKVWEVEIDNGAILEQWNSGFAGTDAGLAIFGEQGQGGLPEPGMLTMLGTNLLIGTGLMYRKLKPKV